jgi:hypothetical protein
VGSRPEGYARAMQRAGAQLSESGPRKCSLIEPPLELAVLLINRMPMTSPYLENAGKRISIFFPASDGCKVEHLLTAPPSS